MNTFLHHSSPKYSNRNDWLWMSPKRSIRILIAFIQWSSQTFLSSQIIHYSFHFLSLPNPTPSNLLHIPHLILLFSFFQQSNDKTQVLLFPPKSFVLFMFWIVLFMFPNHKSIPHTPNPLFPSNFFLSFPNAFPNLFQILHCFIHHKLRQFRSSLSLFFSHFFTQSLPICI